MDIGDSGNSEHRSIQNDPDGLRLAANTVLKAMRRRAQRKRRRSTCGLNRSGKYSTKM
jgi:hypothetical protein